LRSIYRVVIDALAHVSRRGKKIVWLYTSSLVLITLLDGFALIAISKTFNTDNVGSTISSNSRIIPLGVTILSLFLLRSFLSSMITWFCFSSFAEEEVSVGQRNFSEYSNMNWSLLMREPKSTLISYVDRGPHAMTQQLLMSVATLSAETLSALVVFGVILFLDPLTATSTLVFFAVVVFLQHKVISKTSERVGKEMGEGQNQIYDLLDDVSQITKILQVMPSLSLKSHLEEKRRNLARARAQATFIESLPRYLLESMLVLGVGFVGAFTFFLRGNDEVIPSLTIFAVAGFRLLPSVNRIQGLILGLFIREDIARLGMRSFSSKAAKVDTTENYTDNDCLIGFRNVSFVYPNTDTPALSDVSVELQRGKKYALVGPSGAGKTTFVDICMGILNPDSGQIVRNFSKDESVAYVPQDSSVIRGSIALNIALEWSEAYINLDNIQYATNNSAVSEFLNMNLSQLSSSVLSGGQKQRVGIARALYRHPTLLVLDESTSALDSETENRVLHLIEESSPNCTVLIIAHRMSTIKNVDYVIYLENGKILDIDTFTNLRKKLPQFENQIQLGSVDPY
jgi:ABC-type multidrug transport system fused ATPase/permease subunit